MADVLYEEWDPYLRDVIVENNVLIDALELKHIGEKRHNLNWFETEELSNRDIDNLFKLSKS